MFQDGEAGDDGPAAEAIGMAAPSRESSAESLRAETVQRLRDRQPEIEAALLASVLAIPAPPEGDDADYRASTPVVVGAVVDYCLSALEQGASVPLPHPALSQARRGALLGIGVSTDVQRLVAGGKVLSRFIVEEAASVGLTAYPEVMDDLRAREDAMYERLLTAITVEHDLSADPTAPASDKRRLEVVGRLLAGEPVDPREIRYELRSAWHIGVIGVGAGARKVLDGLGQRLGVQHLSVAPLKDRAWTWFGGRGDLPVAEIEGILLSDYARGASFTTGEPGRGEDGWRLTHEQAREALEVAQRRPQRLTRCSDVALEVALLRREPLRRSIIDRYLSRLVQLRMGPNTARETLRAYLDCNGNASSAAHRLGVARHTVENRLREIEHGLGRPIRAAMVELEVALRLATLDGRLAQQTASASPHRGGHARSAAGRVEDASAPI